MPDPRADVPRTPPNQARVMVRRVGWMGAAAGWGVVAGWWMPRGPLTITQALWSVGLSVAVGALAGWLSRPRR